MRKRELSAAAAAIAGLFLAAPAAAQNTNHFTFNVGGGFTEPARYTSNRFNTGFNVNVGAGVNFDPHFGVIGEFGFNDLGLSSGLLSAAGAPGGTARIYSITANPIIRFNPRGRFDVYAIGGGGWYRTTLEFTAPTTGTITAFDPFYGVFYPATVPATAVLGSATQQKSGLNVGGGISIRVRGDSNAKIYAESRYHYIFTTPGRTTVLPVTFGLRW